jgi:hypothetical protein
MDRRLFFAQPGHFSTARNSEMSVSRQTEKRANYQHLRWSTPRILRASKRGRQIFSSITTHDSDSAENGKQCANDVSWVEDHFNSAPPRTLFRPKITHVSLSPEAGGWFWQILRKKQTDTICLPGISTSSWTPCSLFAFCPAVVADAETASCPCK